MDVTALMNLLDNNLNNKTNSSKSENIAAQKPKKKEVPKKIDFSDIRETLEISETKVADNINEPIFSPNPMKYFSMAAIVVTTICLFFGMLYVVDNKADEWFIKASGQKDGKNEGLLSSAATNKTMAKRLANDKKLAENTKNVNGGDFGKISPSSGGEMDYSDKVELLRLLSKKSVKN